MCAVCLLKIKDADLVALAMPDPADAGPMGAPKFRDVEGNVRVHDRHFFTSAGVVAAGLVNMREGTQQKRRQHCNTPVNGDKALHLLVLCPRQIDHPTQIVLRSISGLPSAVKRGS